MKHDAARPVAALTLCATRSESRRRTGRILCAECACIDIVGSAGALQTGDMLIVYTLAQCSTCRAAVAWLRDRRIAFSERAIRETPPTREELSAALKHYHGEVRRLFNTSGEAYRAAGLKDTLSSMSREEAIALLASNGSLVKRPFVIGPGVELVGFKEAEWARVLTAGRPGQPERD